jgi:hypothetical protein
MLAKNITSLPNATELIMNSNPDLCAIFWKKTIVCQFGKTRFIHKKMAAMRLPFFHS